MAALGRLAIAVEADIASFTSDMGKVDRVAKRTAASMEKSINSAARAIGVAAAGAGLAVAALVKRSIDAADQSAKMAQKIGISVEALSGYKFAADQAGVSVEQLQTGLVRLSRSAADAAGGLKQQQAVFRALGISVTDASGKLRSTEALFGDVAEAFSKMEDSAGKTALATRVFGRAGADLIPLLNSGRAGLAAYADEAERLGLIMSTDTAKAAETFNDNLSKLMDSVGGLGYALASEFLPALVDATNAMVEWVKQIRESGALQRAIDWIKAFIGVLDELAVFIATKMVAGALLSFIGSIGALTKAIGAARVAATGWAAVQAALAGPIGLVAAGVAVAVTAIYSLSRAETEAERTTKLFAEATSDAEKYVRGLTGATKDQIAEEIRQIGIKRSYIQTLLDQADAALAAAEAEAAIERQRRAAAAASGPVGLRAFGGNANAVGNTFGAMSAGQGEIDAARARSEELRAKLFETDATYRLLVESINAPAKGRGGAPIVDLTDSAGKAAEELKKLREQAEAFANQTILAMLEQFDPLLAIQLRYEESLRKLLPLLDGTAEGERLYAEALAAVVRMRDADVVATRKAIADKKRQQDVVGLLAEAYAEEAKVLRMSAREAFVYAETQKAIRDALAANKPLLADQIAQIGDMSGAMFDTRESFEEVQEILDEFGGDTDSPILKMIDDLGVMQDELEKVSDACDKAFDPARADELRVAIGKMSAKLQVETIGGYKALLGAAQAFTEEGSKGFQAMELGMAALSIAQDIIALKAAVTAVLSQGQGDPYTAFGRMAAMAAAVAPFLASIGVTLAGIGGGGGGFSDTAGQRQATQGTGTVLGDAEADSESIVNAVEITADASEKLVGLNRGMLRALIQLQDNIGSATTMLARGAGDAEFSALPSIDQSVLGNPSWSLFSRFFGGSAEVTDQGIRIGGGSLSDIDISAFQEVQSRSWRFGSRRTRTEFQDVDDEFESQFQLIIDSIVDTVREGALALGLLPAEIEAALESFRIAEINISLMDLTAEEQQRELEAVFSAIFDGLAEHVVPFIGQFQQVGEGLGETLVRVATSVQVVQEAMRYLGLAIDETDPEKFAQISVALIEAAGGIDEFISGMTAFADAFAPDSFRLEAATTALSEAFAEVGLTIPATRDGIWELMQSLDATTEAGRAQIATLLRLAGVADEYYDLLEDSTESAAEAAERAAEAMEELDRLLNSLASDGWSEPIQQLMRLEEQYREHVARINELAEASGRAAVAEDRQALSIRRNSTQLSRYTRATDSAAEAEAELAIARRWHTRQLQRLAQQLLQQAQDIAAQLGYTPGGASNDPIYGSELGGISEVNAAVEDRYARELQLLQQLDEFVRGMGISNLSPLNPTERLGEAQAEYERLLALAQGGDLDALSQLQGAASAYLGEAQSYYGGVGAYEGIFGNVREQLAMLVGAGPQSEQLGPTTPVIGGPVTVEPGEGWAAQNAIERAILAQQLVDHLAALSIALNTPILELMSTLGIPIAQLATDLGINLQQITGASVVALAQLASDLGLPLGTLVQELGLNLPDLADGIRELADDLGYDLTQLTNGTGTALYDLARFLGVDLDELATSLGQDIGALTETDSPIFLALQGTINTLSPDIRDELDDYLNAIAESPDGESAAANIAAMENHINTLPEGIQELLAPFFPNVNPPGSLTDLDYLRQISLSQADTNTLLAAIRDNTAATAAASIPQYAQGTMFVPTTGMAMLHYGEMVIPSSISDRIRSGDYYLGGDIDRGGEGNRESDAIVRELREVKQKLSALEAVAINTKVIADEARKPQLPIGRKAA